jgi:hypothetical protein
MPRASTIRAALAAPALVFAALPATGAAPVDIQFSLCGEPAAIERALELRPRGAPFDVWLFDDTALALFAKGLRLRLRETKQGADLTLKAADQDCATLSRETVPAGQGKCEYDMHGTKVVGAVSLTRSVDARTAGELSAGRLPLENELSAAQKRFLEGVPGAWPLPSGIRALGPARVRSFSAKDKPYVVDVSELPGGERFIEISRKVASADAPRARDRFEADLARTGVTVCADQSAQAVNKLRALLRRP